MLESIPPQRSALKKATRTSSVMLVAARQMTPSAVHHLAQTSRYEGVVVIHHTDCGMEYFKNADISGLL